MDFSTLLDLIQWPAMAATILASWLVASSNRRRRHAGFWAFLLSNVLWVAWGWQADAPALIAMQVCLAAMNVRGTWKTESPCEQPPAHTEPASAEG